jgi:RNA polymerase sigma-70 factor (ECF subfamily)
MLENLLSDRHVVRRVLRGHTDSFRILVDRYGGMLYVFAYAHTGNAHDAEDMVQDAFVRLWQWLDRVSAERSVGPWLVRVARNLIIDAARRRDSERERMREAQLQTHADAPDYARRELHAAFWRELANLEADDREILILSYFQGRRAKDVAQLLDISPDAAAKRLQRARAELGRRILDSVGAEIISRKPSRARANRIMSAIAVTPAAWKAGVSVSLAGAVVVGATATKFLAGVAAIAVTAALASWFFFGAGWGARKAPDITASSKFEVRATAPAVPTPEPQPAKPAAGNEAAPNPTGDPATTSDPEQDSLLPPDFHAAVYGVVVDESGQPVPSALVGITTEKGATGSQQGKRIARDTSITTTADREGRFVFKALPIKLSSQPILEKVWAQSGNLYGDMDVELDTASRNHCLELILQPSLPLGGVVIDEKGAAVPEAELYIIAVVMGHPLDPTWTISAKSDKSGHFLFEHLAPGRYKVRAGAENFLLSSGDDFEAGTMNAAIILKRGCTISGRTIAPDGSPATGFRLTAGLEGKPASSGAEVEADGRFLIGGLNPGAYELALKPLEGRPSRYALREPIRVTVDKDVAGLQVHVVNGARISGRVLDAAGLGIAEARVAGNDKAGGGAETTAGSDGGYVLEGAPVGEVKMSAEKDGYERLEMTLPNVETGADLKGVDLRMKELPAVKGTVVDSSGTPVAQASVAARESLGKDEWSTVTDEAGKFKLYIKPVDAVYLQAFNENAISNLVGPVAPLDQEYELRLRESGRIEGEVVNTSGEPMIYAVIQAKPIDETANQIGQALPHYLVEEQKPTQVTVFADSRGTFLSGPLLSGKYKLEIYDDHSGLLLAVAETEVPEGRTVHARLVVDVSGYGSIEGIVTSHGTPEPAIWMLPHIGDWNCQSTPSGLDGRYMLRLVQPGNGYIEVIKQGTGMAIFQKPVEVVAGQTTELNVDVSGTGTGVEGSVDVDGKPAPVMNLLVFPASSDKEVAEVTTNWEGRYLVDPLQEGLYRVVVKVRLLRLDPPGVLQSPPVLVQPTDVEVKSGQMSRCDFHLTGGVISGAVRGIRQGECAYVGLFGGEDAPTEITPELVARLLSENVVQKQKVTQEGQFIFQSLLPGDYAVAAVIVGGGQDFQTEPVMQGLESGRFDIQQVRLEPGQGLTVDVNLGGK